MRFTSDELEPLDQYYATRELAKECCDLLDFTKYSTILEPSAGTGVFLEFLPREKTQAIDIDPKHPDIIKNKMPNLVGMPIQDVLFLLENYGLDVMFSGKGAVKSQSIIKGSRIQKGQKIFLELS